jgi:hypothetical protein
VTDDQLLAKIEAHSALLHELAGMLETAKRGIGMAEPTFWPSGEDDNALIRATIVDVIENVITRANAMRI